jgi:phage terminase small subunit
MSDQSDTNDIKPASFDPVATAATLGMSDQQLKWALAVLRGANQTQACREAGYTGPAEQMRSQGSRNAGNRKIVRFLELAALEGGGIAEMPMDAKERHRVLSRMARGTDKNSAIRACEVLQRMDSEARAIEEAAAKEGDPVDTLKEIAELSPLQAITLHKQHDYLKWQPTPEQVRRAKEEALEFLQAQRETALSLAEQADAEVAALLNAHTREAANAN